MFLFSLINFILFSVDSAGFWDLPSTREAYAKVPVFKPRSSCHLPVPVSNLHSLLFKVLGQGSCQRPMLTTPKAYVAGREVLCFSVLTSPLNKGRDPPPALLQVPYLSALTVGSVSASSVSGPVSHSSAVSMTISKPPCPSTVPIARKPSVFPHRLVDL